MTDFFSSWCNPPNDQAINKQTASHLQSNDDNGGISAVVKIMPKVYAKKKNLQRIAQRHGKTGVANLLSNKIPTKQSSRSGDMGEILGTVYLRDNLGYSVGPSRLIERDHQEWAMRGDDILGARFNQQGGLELAKVEAKSRRQAKKPAIVEAREGLQRNGDLASPHSLVQFAERLLKNDKKLSDAINDLLQKKGLSAGQITHVMFIFAGNFPISDVREDLSNYTGKVKQKTVTLQVQAHQDFIRTSYETVLAHDA